MPATTGLLTVADPLVVPPEAEFSGWLERVIEVIKSTWASLALIALITVVLPAFVLSLLSAGTNLAERTQADNGTLHFTGAVVGISLGFGCASLIMAIVAAYLAALGSAAAVWVITQRAAGRPTPLRQAFRYGRTRAVPIWGWSLLAALMVVAGLCACVFPGLYFLVATSMVVPVVAYERAPGIPRSFSLINSSFGTALGRLVTLALVLLVLSCIGGLPSALTQAALLGAGGATRWLGASGAGIWQAALTLPIFVIATAGIVVTYTELRARQQARAGGGYLTTAQLLAELG